MDGHIDWLSFTIPHELPINSPQELLSNSLIKLEREYPNVYKTVIRECHFEHVVGRAPYRFSLASENRGVRLFGGGTTDTILTEVSGRGCDALRGEAAARRVLSEVSDRCTRFDYAVDLRCRTLPSEFANHRTHQTFRTGAHLTSDTGETVYVGSPKSDRMARVYRYNHPHPRHELLRVEFVFRRGLARSAAQDFCASKNTQAFIANCGNTYGWSHPEWQPSVLTDEKLSTNERSKSASGTVHWLYTQVAPAMRRLLKEDALDLTDFLEHVYNQ